MGKLLGTSLAARGVAETIVVLTSALPLNDGVAPRDPGQSYASVTIQGVITTGPTPVTSVIARIIVAGSTTATFSQSVSSGTFSFVAQVPAVCVSHTLRVTWSNGSTETLIAVATNICGGDLFLADGQSNEVAGMEPSGSSSANGEQNPWVRSFGYRTPNAPNPFPYWYPAEGDAFQDGAGAIGQWQLRLYNQLVLATGIPVGVISNGLGGMPIEGMTRNPANPGDTSTHCGIAYWRAQTAGIRTGIRCALFRQGESNGGSTGADYTAKFTTFRAGWLADYPNIDRIYVCQIRGNNLDLLEAQRSFQDLFPNLTVVSSNGLTGLNGLHFNYINGHQTFGDWMKRLIARDRYGIAGTNIDTPNVNAASIAGNVITITLRANDSTSLSITGAGIEAFFGVDAGRTIASVAIVGGNIQVTLNAGAGTPTYVWHWAYISAQPYIVNALGVGLSSFKIPVT